MTSDLRSIPAEEMARRLYASSTAADHRFAFFIGAGCSKSSGIPTAGELVERHWLPRLRSLCDPDCTDDQLPAWAGKRFPEFDPDIPAASYGDVMEQLFLHPGERQAEIEVLCEGKFPRFGYATLASLVAHERGSFNVVLTTNFDDLIADALYLFTESRPLVIQHAALSEYIRPTRSRPLVVKIHGDHQLSPLNTAEETKELAESIRRAVQSLLHDRGLIFLGYGGADQGILKMLQALSPESLPFGVYWVSRKEPQGAVRTWLKSRNAVWVPYHDFDKFMVLVRSTFSLPTPDEKRFEEIFRRYADDYISLAAEIGKLSDAAPSASALKDAVKRTDATFEGVWSAILEARRLKKTDPEGAEARYQRAIKEFPTSSDLLGDFALFLDSVRNDYDQAEVFYRRALEADPNDADNLGNFANFSSAALEDYDQAEQFYRRAIELDPNQALNFGNYAGFLLAAGRNQEGIVLLQRALALPSLNEHPDLLAELRFYGFAHGDASERHEQLRDLRRLLEEGVRSPDWDLSRNVERACADSHPDCLWLGRLASVIADEAQLATLAEWPAWRAVGNADTEAPQLPANAGPLSGNSEKI